MRLLIILVFVVASVGLVYPQSAATQGTGVQPRIWRAFEMRASIQTDAWFRRGDFPRSVQFLSFRAALFPDNYDELTNLAWLLESMEMFDQAEAVLMDLLRNNPKNPDASWPIAHFHFRRKNYAQTVRFLAPSITMTPRPHPNSFRTLALAYEGMDRLEDALRVWDLLLTFTVDATAERNRDRVRQKLQERKERTSSPIRLNERSTRLR